MLSRIYIQNFALIERLEIQLGKGLQVITGETGAGKSIILGALRLILGERADLKSIADSSQKSVVEAEFEAASNLQPFFDENDLDFEPQTIIRREILPTGKSRAFVNDVPVTLDILRELSSNLIDIHSQFETSNLFTEAFQFKMIDGLAGSKSVIVGYQQEFLKYRELKKQLVDLETRLAEGEKESDYKIFLLNELQDASLDDVDFEELQAQHALQENAEAILEKIGAVLQRFDEEQIGVNAGLTEIRNHLTKTAELSSHFSELQQRFDSNFLELKDIVDEISTAAEKVENDPQLLEQLNSKLNKINALFQKHQVKSVKELIELRDKIAGEQSGFAELEQYIESTEREIGLSHDRLQKLAEKISVNRKKAAPVFSKKVESLLSQLGLEKAKIEVELTAATDFNQHGQDAVKILFQANSGFPLKPVQESISGGERSRVMLAVKKLMAENAELPTLILDEIDTGVSGKVAEEMGNVMRDMSKNMQLIVITHLAQVAAKGDNNYKVVKMDLSGKTQSNIIPLSESEKLQEIAQLLSGSKITDAALKQAEELMK